MRYFMCSDKDGKLKILTMYKSQEEAVKRIKYHVKKEKCVLKIIPLPEINLGCKIYHKDGSYYGTIVHETNALWGISEVSKSDAIPNPYIKQRIDQLIISRELMVVDGVEFTIVDDYIQLVSELDSKVSGVMKSLEYINAQQVAFFSASNL